MSKWFTLLKYFISFIALLNSISLAYYSPFYWRIIFLFASLFLWFNICVVISYLISACVRWHVTGLLSSAIWSACRRFTDSSFYRFFHLTSRVCHSARFSRHWSAFGRFFKIRFERFDRSPSSIMPTYLYPTEVPTNVSFRSECSRCLLSKTERWLTIFLDWYVFEPNVKSNLTLALSSPLSFSLFHSIPF